MAANATQKVFTVIYLTEVYEHVIEHKLVAASHVRATCPCNGAIRAVFWGLAKSDFESNSYPSSFSYCAAFYEEPDMLLVKSRFW